MICADLRKEIGQRQMETKTLKEELDKRNRQIQKEKKEYDASNEEVEKLKVHFKQMLKRHYHNELLDNEDSFAFLCYFFLQSDLVNVNAQPSIIGKEADKLQRQKK